MAFLNTSDPAKPAYVHQEYPKHVNFTDGKFIVVKDKAEEDLTIAENTHRLPKPKSVIVAEQQNETEALKKAKMALVSIAEKFDIPIDKRWSLEKINDAINDVLNAEPEKVGDETGEVKEE
jgi:hypothetical protein